MYLVEDGTGLGPAGHLHALGEHLGLGHGDAHFGALGVLGL